MTSRFATLPCVLALAVAPLLAQADDTARPRVSSDQCSISTPYNVLVDTGGVWLYRDEGMPKEVFFHDGTLSVDRQVQAVSEADAARLREMEHGARQLMPAVTGVARESVDITFDALAGVVEALTGSRRKARQMERFRADTLAHVDSTIGTGRWDQDVFGEGFEARIEAAAERMAGSLGRSVLWQVFTGRAGRMEARAERMEAELERRIEARSVALEAHANALCAQVETLHALQQSLDYRLDGAPLTLLEVAPRERDGETAVTAGID
ncbi:YggN family protein [Luteimonas sp. BDR2-5]|uniref:DUF2884 family protein n=1 Tax=Proluteimonas luteida TaxID=2878685 RepID=UPI001E30F8DA|nr:DUF2884 family protein [Luteimonas sp. BDR2-5]MCD9028825.1 YggN family protein [Luteimonas sp. BDR2-5]